MAQVKTVSDIDCRGKRVLVRVDFNVPMKEGAISDDTRIRAALPTIQYLIKHDADRIILMSHLGRPEGKTASLSLAPIADRLSALLGKEVIFVPDCIGPQVEETLTRGSKGSVYLLENLRFYPAEEKPQTDPSFVENLANLGDIYINDAFGTAHRSHSSTAVIAKYFPHRCGTGFLMMKEIDSLGTHMKHPQKPFTAIIGGAKVSTKLGVLNAFMGKVDTLLIGGAMSYTFFKARGIPIGNSLVEEEMMQEAKEIEERANQEGVQLILPVDIVVTQKKAEGSASKIVSMLKEGIPKGYEGVDIGPNTVLKWKPYIEEAKTLFWNGPVGVFEIEPFAQGTFSIAKTVAGLKGRAFTVVGGGDSASALEKLGIQHEISHVSTGGGASLEFIEQGNLPGIQAIEEAWGSGMS